MNNIQKHLCFLLLFVILWNGFSGTVCLAADHSFDQWYLDEIGLPSVSSDFPLPDAASLSENHVTIAVIDTGTFVSHPALKNSLWINEKEKNGETGVDDDGNGYVDDIYGYNVKSDNGDVTDTDGHGTHVAGIIAMRSTSSDTSVGVFPDARIMTVKAGNTTSGFSSANLMKAITYAMENGADVINMSLGTSYCSDGLRELIAAASHNAIIVAAAGNGALPTKESPTDSGENIYPAAHPDVIGVMSFNHNHELSWFSNWDRQPGHEEDYEMIAPGDDIYSTTLRNKYKQESGTSMSTPMVSAACGILISEWRIVHSTDSGSASCRDRSFPTASIKDCLVHGSGAPILYVDSSGRTITYPRLDIENALRYLHEHYPAASVSGNGETVSDNDPDKDPVSDNSVGQTPSDDDPKAVSDHDPGTDDPTDPPSSQEPADHPTSDSPSSLKGDSNSSMTANRELIRSIQSLTPVLQKKKLYRIRKGGSDLTGEVCHLREWNRTRLTVRVQASAPDGCYLYRSISKNGRYRICASVKGTRILLKKKKQHYYYYVKAYKIIDGKRYLSHRSRKIRI